MSDFYDPNNPRRDSPYDPNVRGANSAWGWVAGAVLVVVVLAIAFGAGHAPTPGGGTMSSNHPPPMTRTAPAPGGPVGTLAPTPANPTPAPPK